MTPVDNTVPVSARINLAGANGGTKVDLTCSYNKTSPSDEAVHGPAHGLRAR